MFDQIVQFLQDLISSIGYAGVFVVMFAENLFPPIPTDPLLPFAGILVADGQFSFMLVWICAVAGAMTGTLLLYGIGAWADEHVIRRFIRRYGHWVALSEDQLDRTFGLVDQYGVWFILIGRSIPLVRSAVSLAAGMSRMSITKFLLFSAINSALITGFWIAAGVLLGENWRAIFDALNRSPWLLMTAAALIIVAFILYILYRRNQPSRKPVRSLEEGH